ncbi:MAG: NACHT domain-containing protein [Desulfobulbaceae bacterium]|nr:NACHT domain-containing protein [Desulfobulbaceae bacterium]
MKKKVSEKKWQDFERQVEDLFRLRGYLPVPDTRFAGRQHDLVIHTGEEASQPILVECKYHDPACGALVGVEELEDFAARVLRLRNSGDISTGYLVTNTGFTSHAKGAFHNRPEDKFVLLRTISELRRGLINFDRYILHIIEEFGEGESGMDFEPLLMRCRGKAGRSESADAIEALTRFIGIPEPALCVVTGDYGTGKTTVCRRLAYLLANEVRNGGTTRVPIYVPLKWYSQAGGATALLQRFLDEHALTHTNVNALLSMHAAGQLVLILDGFDEMLRRSTEQTRRESIQDLAELCVKSSKVLLTGRSGYFVDEFELKKPFRGLGISGVRERIRQATSSAKLSPGNRWLRYELLQLDSAQIKSFLLRKAHGKSKEDREKYVERVLTAIASTYNLADLARRPILLDMISETLGRNKVARNAAELYGIYVDAWLDIDAAKGAFRSLVSMENRLAFSIALAWILQDSGVSEIHWQELQGLVGSYFQLEESDDVDHFGGDIRTSTFLNRNEGGFYQFAHFSFQEYFCARYLVVPPEELRDLFDDILSEPDITLAELAYRSSATLDFAGDMLGCPVNPYYWQQVRELIATNQDRLINAKGADSGRSIDINSVRRMLEMAEGEAAAFELSDMAEAYKNIYRQLSTVVSEELKNSHEPEPWLLKLNDLLDTGRSSAPEAAER